jgi:hypothetical protein
MRPAQGGQGHGTAGTGGRGTTGGGGTGGGSGSGGGSGTSGGTGSTGGTSSSGGSGGTGGKGGAARTRPPQVSHPGPQPGRQPTTMQPAPAPPGDSGSGDSGSGDSEPWDSGFFYLYDNYSPESSYVADEPCRIVCQSDSSVQCSSYSGQCSGLPDRLICDGQAVMCPAGDALDQTNPPGQSDQATQSDQRCAARPAGSDQGQLKTDPACNAPAGGATRAQRCDDRRAGRHQGQGKAAVSCSGANGTP